MTSGLALLALWSVCQKLNRVSSVQFSYIALCAKRMNSTACTRLEFSSLELTLRLQKQTVVGGTKII